MRSSPLLGLSPVRAFSSTCKIQDIVGGKLLWGKGLNIGKWNDKLYKSTCKTSNSIVPSKLSCTLLRILHWGLSVVDIQPSTYSHRDLSNNVLGQQEHSCLDYNPFQKREKKQISGIGQEDENVFQLYKLFHCTSNSPWNSAFSFHRIPLLFATHHHVFFLFMIKLKLVVLWGIDFGYLFWSSLFGFLAIYGPFFSLSKRKKLFSRNIIIMIRSEKQRNWMKTECMKVARARMQHSIL